MVVQEWCVNLDRSVVVGERWRVSGGGSEVANQGQ